MSERRLDPTTGEWVTVASDRQDRTYQPDPAQCPLCPRRPGRPVTEIPRADFEIAVFANRFSSLRLDPPPPAVGGSSLLRVEPSFGHCEVVVYSADHNATLATVGRRRIHLLVDVWAQRTAELGGMAGIAYVMPFENKGEAVGVTLSHPHGQIYAYPEVRPGPSVTPPGVDTPRWRRRRTTALEHPGPQAAR